MIDRTQNTTAEGAVLGSIILDPKTLPAVKDILRDAYYFVKPEHRIIYAALNEMADADTGWDLVVLRNILTSRKQLHAIGGVDYMVKLAETVPSAANAAHYANQVHDAYKRRKMTELAKALVAASEDEADVNTHLAELQGDLSELIAENTETRNGDGLEMITKKIDQSGKMQGREIHMPWSTINSLTFALQPGMVTIICGTPGASKSFAAMEILTSATVAGVRTNYFALEHSTDFHLMRALAQHCRIPELTNPNWVANNTIVAKAAAKDNADWLRQMGDHIDTQADGKTTYAKLLNWTLQQARSGSRLIIIDPVTAVQHLGSRIWDEDNEFVHKLKRILVAYQTAAILITHPPKTNSLPGMESMAGGAAFQRFTQTILWLEAHDEKESDVRYPTGTETTKHNRTIHLAKSTLGPGRGSCIAATFTNELRLIEHGVITKRKKK